MLQDNVLLLVTERLPNDGGLCGAVMAHARHDHVPAGNLGISQDVEPGVEDSPNLVQDREET